MSNPEEKGLAIPDKMALDKVPRSDVVAMLLETAGTIKLTDAQRKIVFGKVEADLVEIREDGIVYLPAVEYKRTLCEAFGLEWAVVPESPKPVEVDGLILWGFYLFVQGQPVAFAWGEQKHQMGDHFMSYGDAMEGAKSNAIMRLCKQIGIAQDLWRPSFIRKWRHDHAESFEARNRQGKRVTMWRRLENTGNTEEQEADEFQEEEEIGDTDRFRRTAFLMVEYLPMDAVRMKAEVKEMFGVDSRALLAPAQWKEYRDYLAGTMTEIQAEDYGRWLDVRKAVKLLTERGMDKKDLKFYLCTHFLRLDILNKDIPEDLAQRLSRSGNADEYYARLQRAVQAAKEWGESIGGSGKAAELLENLGGVLDDMKDTTSLAEFFNNLGVAPREDGTYELTDITPAMFVGWKAALGADDEPPESEEDAQSDTNGTGRGNAQVDPPEEQEQPAGHPEWDVTSATRREIGKLLVKLEIYDGPRSPKFKERIKNLIGRDLLKMQAMMETEGQAIIASLNEELDMMGEQGMADPASGNSEIVDHDPLGTGVNTDRFCDTPEWKELHHEYFSRLKANLDATGQPLFGTPKAHTAWEQETTGRTSVIHWDAEVFGIVHKALDDMEVVTVWDSVPATPTEQGSGDDSEGRLDEILSGEQEGYILAILDRLLPRAVNAKVAPQTRHWISKAIGGRSPGVSNLTSEQAGKVIGSLQALAEERGV